MGLLLIIYDNASEHICFHIFSTRLMFVEVTSYAHFNVNIHAKEILLLISDILFYYCYSIGKLALLKKNSN